MVWTVFSIFGKLELNSGTLDHLDGLIWLILYRCRSDIRGKLIEHAQIHEEERWCCVRKGVFPLLQEFRAAQSFMAAAGIEKDI